MESYLKKRLLTIGLFSVITVFVWSFDITNDSNVSLSGSLGNEWLGLGSCPAEELCVAFLDIGQGDSIFISSPSGQQLLIDGGRDGRVLSELSKVMGVLDRDLDYVLMTHPDADHIGGLVDVLESYQVDAVIKTNNESDTNVWRQLSELVDEEGVTIYLARRGQRYDLGEGVVFEILFPDTDVSRYESNSSSIVGRLTYGDTSFILTGDAPKSIEEYLVLLDGEYLKSGVLKVGHHGSRTSTSELFLDEVQPEYAVISAGEDNQYGHPHVEVTDMLFNAGVNTLSTAEEGTIIFTSDGSSLKLLN